MIKAVVFDLDGTLVDTMGHFADVAADVIARRHGWSVARGRKAYLDTSGIPFFQQLEVLFPGHSDNSALEAEFETRKMTAYDGRSFLEDVPPAIALMREQGVAAVVSSNNREDVVREYIAGEGVHFDVVLGFRDDFYKGEPHFAFVERELGIARDEMLFVGDSVRDAELALGAGVRFAARLGTVARESFVEALGAVDFIDPGQLGDFLRGTTRCTSAT